PFPVGIHDSSNIPQQSNLYQKVKDPFSGIETYAIQAIHPDVAILHVQKASMDGNCIHLGSVVTDRLMATASKTVIITCDELISVDEIRKNPNTTTIPSIFVDYIINLKFAAHPTSSHGMYSYDNEEIKEYLNATRSEESYNTYIDSRTSISEDEYLEKFAKHGNFTRKTFGESNEKYSIEELITCIFARDIKDGEVGICGAVSDIPMAAMQLAERNYNKQIKWIAGGSGYINPRGFLVPSSTDFQMSYSADARLSMDEVIPIEMREIDFFFAGGLQIDERGNSNLAGIPKDGGWKLRGPGSVGLPFLPKAKRVYLYTMSHNTRTLVNKVNYISGPGHIGNNQMGNGPTLLVTNKCVFKWNYNEDKWELESIHPGNSLTDIKETTGFEFEFDNITETPEPTEDELRVLRDIDKVGYLRGIRE
ncbi:MAG: hypothetical protein OEY49_11010, partial [Candidatus Heimdallarchaeota archaeon]|nr:hypothetical protein [Candidatus Heimdallarchaeota archaeon]